MYHHLLLVLSTYVWIICIFSRNKLITTYLKQNSVANLRFLRVPVSIILTQTYFRPSIFSIINLFIVGTHDIQTHQGKEKPKGQNSKKCFFRGLDFFFRDMTLTISVKRPIGYSAMLHLNISLLSSIEIFSVRSLSKKKKNLSVIQENYIINNNIQNFKKCTI